MGCYRDGRERALGLLPGAAELGQRSEATLPVGCVRPLFSVRVSANAGVARSWLQNRGLQVRFLPGLFVEHEASQRTISLRGF